MFIELFFILSVSRCFVLADFHASGLVSADHYAVMFTYFLNVASV